jgi:hypothetical protein
VFHALLYYTGGETVAANAEETLRSKCKDFRLYGPKVGTEKKQEKGEESCSDKNHQEE